LTITAAKANGRKIDGNGSVAINAGGATLAANLGLITTTTSSYTGTDASTITGKLPAAGTCTINNSITLGADDLLNTTATYTIIGGKTLTATAARLNGHKINGAGSVTINDGGATLAANLSLITTTTSTYNGTDASLITGKLPAGVGTCTINNSITLNADNLLNTTATYTIIGGKTLTATAARLNGH
jgi:filamentous hemagglutinin